MAKYPRTFRSSPWVFAILFVALTISVAGTRQFSSQQGSALATFALGMLVAVFTIGLIEAITARVVLGTEFLEIVSNFRRKRVLRTEILRVVAEKGAPIALELRSGGWLKLPSVGAVHPNAIRAGLKQSSD
jgi:phosphatidylglycerophosphate synthase